MARKNILLEVSAIINEVKSGKFRPVYLLMGDESYYIDLVTNTLINEIFKNNEEAKDFDLKIFYGKDSVMKDVVSCARQYPMLAGKNVVVLKEAKSMKDFEDIQLYFKRIQESTVFIINYKNGTLDKRKKSYTTFKNNAYILQSDKLKYDSDIQKWMVGYLKNRNISIDNKSTIMLSQFIGNDLSRIVGELDKLILILPKGSKITPEIVEKHIGVSKDFNDFELLKAVTTRNIYKANFIIKQMSGNPHNSIIKTIAAFFYFYSNLMMFHYVVDKSQGNVCSTLGISYYAYKDLLEASKKYSAAKTMRVIHTLRLFDAKSKGVDSFGTSEFDLIREMIFEILH